MRARKEEGGRGIACTCDCVAMQRITDASAGCSHPLFNELQHGLSACFLYKKRAHVEAVVAYLMDRESGKMKNVGRNKDQVRDYICNSRVG